MVMVRYRPDQTSGWREYPEVNVVRALRVEQLTLPVKA